MFSQDGMVKELPIHTQISQQAPLGNVSFHRTFKSIKFYCICESTEDIVEHYTNMRYRLEGLLPVLAPGQAFK